MKILETNRKKKKLLLENKIIYLLNIIFPYVPLIVSFNLEVFILNKKSAYLIAGKSCCDNNII